MRRTLLRLPSFLQAQHAASSSGFQHLRYITHESAGPGPSLGFWHGDGEQSASSRKGISQSITLPAQLQWAGLKQGLSRSSATGCMPLSLAGQAQLRHYSAGARDNTSEDSPSGAGSAAATPHQEPGHTTAAAGSQQSPHQGVVGDQVMYQGPLSKTHKLLKHISLANTLIAFCAAPVIIEYAEVSYASRVGLAASLVLFGVITTGALHWITHPYIHELKYNPGTGMIDVKMASFFGGSRHEQFNIADVHPLPWNRPVATFMANNKYYYIDVYSFPDEALLRRLTPDPDTVPPGYKDDKDDD